MGKCTDQSYECSSTCHERTPSGSGKSVCTLLVAARHRDGWASGDAKYIHLAILPTTITTVSDIPNEYTHCHNYVCYSSKPKRNAT